MARKLKDPYFQLSGKIDYLANDIGGLFETVGWLKREIATLRSQLSEWHGIMDDHAAASKDKAPAGALPPKEDR